MTDTLKNAEPREISGSYVDEIVAAGDAIIVPIRSGEKPTVTAYPEAGATASVFVTNDPDEAVSALTAEFSVAWEPGDVTEATQRGIDALHLTGIRLAATAGPVRFAVTK